MSTFTFTVYGTPAPQGSKRHVGRGILIESSKALRPWRDILTWHARDAARQARWDGHDAPVCVTLAFHLARPKSAPKRRVWPSVKPDIDKLSRAVLDALVDAAVLRDDAQVVHLDAAKGYGDPGVDITITTIDHEETTR